MDTKKVLIVEDDLNSIKMLEKLIAEVDKTVVCYAANTVEQAYALMHQHIIDVFLLDIILNTKVLGDVSGMRLAEEIRAIARYRFTPIIFISSLEDPKMYAYSSVHSFKYIEKPFHIRETKETIREALLYNKYLEEDKFLYFRKDGVLFSVKENDIVYVESKRNKILICTMKEVMEIPYKTCNEMLEMLNATYFVQCNRSTIVNRRKIESIDTCNKYISFAPELGYDSVVIGTKYMKDILG